MFGNKKMINPYLKNEVVKMGVWSLTPGDCETWHGEHTNRYFKKFFGVPKDSLVIYEYKTGFEHAYVTKKYFKQLHKQIDKINKNNFLNLSKKLIKFYGLLRSSKKVASQAYKNPKKLSNKELAKNFYGIRDRIHELSIFDQFTWLAEEYWTPKIENILINKLKIPKQSDEYNHALFALTKPEEISTTLREKMAVLEQVLKIKNYKQTVKKAARILTKKFGWLPVFCYGDPWQNTHYEAELLENLKKPIKKIREDFNKLKDYEKIRNQELQKIVNKYNIKKQDLQIFIDFGLAIDTRNEAEYFVSFAGFYLLPLYKEIARRLFLTTTQVRLLSEKEMLDSIIGKANPNKILSQRTEFYGWGFYNNFEKRINFTSKEAKKLFNHIESYVKPIQGGNEKQGTCASPGKAVGKVRIIPSPEFNNRVKDGDILFTYATTTDYLPAMKRAGAIITEVGGLTCHAAVVSREFGIPCIVALANAMKNFKDGDIIEVDANKGIVRKIK